jgi:hypothetical protein
MLRTTLKIRTTLPPSLFSPIIRCLFTPWTREGKRPQVTEAPAQPSQLLLLQVTDPSLSAQRWAIGSEECAPIQCALYSDRIEISVESSASISIDGKPRPDVEVIFMLQSLRAELREITEGLSNQRRGDEPTLDALRLAASSTQSCRACS